MLIIPVSAVTICCICDRWVLPRSTRALSEWRCSIAQRKNFLYRWAEGPVQNNSYLIKNQIKKLISRNHKQYKVYSRRFIHTRPIIFNQYLIKIIKATYHTPKNWKTKTKDRSQGTKLKGKSQFLEKTGLGQTEILTTRWSSCEYIKFNFKENKIRVRVFFFLAEEKEKFKQRII
jgi:Zn-dependent metalloprotease